MKKCTVILGLAVALVSAAVPAVAAEGWSGDVAFGYTRKSGNTRSSAAALDVNAVLDRGAWRHTANLEYDFESQNRSTTEEDAYLSWKSDYRISEWEYFYGFASVKDDRFSGIDEEYLLSAGYGRVLISSPLRRLEVEAGPGVRKTNPTRGETRTEGVARLAQLFTWKLSETADFKQDLSVETGGGNTTTKFSAALEARVVENIGLRLAYHAEHVHRVPADRHRTDTKVVASIVYRFQ